MTPDTALILGLFLMVLAIPSLVSAWIDGRAPLVAALLLVCGGASAYYAHTSKEGGYALLDIPMVIYSMIGQVLNGIL